MKKKILIVFLICCMLLGVPSAAMAADDIYGYYNPGLTSSGSTLYHYPNIIVTKSDPSFGFLVQLYDKTNIVDSPLHFPVYYDNSQSDYLYLYFDVTGYESYVSGVYTSFYYGEYKSDGHLYAASVTCDDEFVSINNSTFLRVSISNSFSYVSTISSLNTSQLYPVLGSAYLWENGVTNNVLGELPPQMMELGITQIQVTTGQQVVGMIQTLLPYGIGCLALLISLPLLLKVLRRFLG